MPNARATKQDREAAREEILVLLEELRVSNDPDERFQLGSEIALAIMAQRGLGPSDESASLLDGEMLDLALEALLAAVAVRPWIDEAARPDDVYGEALEDSNPCAAARTPELAAPACVDAPVAAERNPNVETAVAIPDGCEDALKHVAQLCASSGFCRACGAGAGRCVEFENAEGSTSIMVRFVCGGCGGPLSVTPPRIIRRNRKKRVVAPDVAESTACAPTKRVSTRRSGSQPRNPT